MADGGIADVCMTDRWMMDGWSDVQIGWMAKCTDDQVNRWMDGWMVVYMINGWMVQCIDWANWMDGFCGDRWMDGQVYR